MQDREVTFSFAELFDSKRKITIEWHNYYNVYISGNKGFSKNSPQHFPYRCIVTIMGLRTKFKDMPLHGGIIV